MSSIGILGVDVGFASIGVALLVHRDGAWHVAALSVVETKPTAKKRKVLAVEDNIRRAQEIGAAIDGFRSLAGVVAIASEAFSPPRSSSVASKIGMMVGVLSEIARANRIPFLQATPQTVKMAVCKSRKASKEEVEAAIRGLYLDANDLLDRIVPSKREHAADALAAVHVCLRSPEIEMALRIAGMNASAGDSP